MHLIVRERGSLDEDEPARDLDLAPADIVLLSFSDSDLASIAAAPPPPGVTVRAVNLARLRHPMSVDLFVERTIPGSGVVVARLLGGVDYWRYGADELADSCRRHGVPLAMLAGCVDSEHLAARTTIGAARRAQLDGFLRAGGAANAGRALRLLHAIARGVEAPDEVSEALPAAGRADALCRPGERASGRPDERISGRPDERISGRPGDGPTGRAALVLYRSHLLADDVASHAALADALAAEGLAVDALFVDSPKSAAGARLLRDALGGGDGGANRPDIVLNATGFSARDPDNRSPLAAADRPVLQVLLAGNGRDAWAGASRGLSPADLAMQVVLPELDGNAGFHLVGHKEPADGDGPCRFVPYEDGIRRAARAARGLVRLGRLPAGARRIAIVLSDYPGLAGHRHAVGHAVGLDTFASLRAILLLLRAEGYVTGSAPVDDAATLARRLAADGTLRFGRITVALQPARAGDGTDAAIDARAAYHDPVSPPTDRYASFYRALAAGHDALVHLGTHGTLEWLPGKAVALGPDCLPARLVDDLPVIYPFIVNNPGEAAVARRRIGAVTIGHLTPPLVPVRLAPDAHAVERLLDEHAAADGLDRRRTIALRAEILARAGAAGLLAEAGGAATGDDADSLARLDAYLCDLKEMRVGDGLHVFGAPPRDPGALLGSVGDAHRDALDACPRAERDALLAALDARFVAPGPGGAPNHGRADVLPTGRNLSAIDPRAMPTPAAFASARRNATALLRRHEQDTGEPLRRLVLDLWGSAAIRTGGADLALAFVLLGVDLVHDPDTSRVTAFEVLPLALLDRPRVDVTLRVSGLFRDGFAAQVALFDAAVRRVAARDEAPADNPLAATGTTRRVFGPAPGRFGAGTGADGDWLAHSSHAYGGGSDGEPDGAALARLVGAADAFLHAQDHRDTDVLDGPEHASHAGGFARAAASLGNDPVLYHADLSDRDAPRIRHLRDEIARVTRGRLGNPAWLASMRRHGWRGATEMARGVEALCSFADLLPVRLDPMLDIAAELIRFDGENRAFLADANPEALRAIEAALDGALARGRWHPRRNAAPAGVPGP